MSFRRALTCFVTVAKFAIGLPLAVAAFGAVSFGIFAGAGAVALHFGLSEHATTIIGGATILIALSTAIGVMECLDGRGL